MNRRIILALAAALVLSACGQGQEPARKEVVFSILSAESQASAEKDWAPFIADMSKAIGQPVKAYYGSNYTALIEAMRFKQTDLGWFTNQSGLEAVRRGGGQVFARSANPVGLDGYESVIIVKKGSGLTLEKILACDKTLNFGMGDPKSTSGTLAPMTFLFAPRKIDPSACFKNVRSANHETNLFSVSGGMQDAATNNTASMDRLRLLDTDLARNTLANVEIVWRSPRIPEDPLVWRRDLDPALRKKIGDFMFSYGVGDTPEAARQRAVLEKIQTMPFVPPTTPTCCRCARWRPRAQLVEARNRKDAAAIAKAEASLAEIAKEKARAWPLTPAGPAQQEVAGHAGDRLGAAVLPALDLNIGDAAADLAQDRPGKGRLRAGGPQVLDGDVDGLGDPPFRLGQRQLGQRRHLHEGADHPAMQGREHRVADQVLGEGQDGGHLVAGHLHPHAEVADVGDALEEGVEVLERGDRSSQPRGLSMKVAWAVATRSAESTSQAWARTKPMERVSL